MSNTDTTTVATTDTSGVARTQDGTIADQGTGTTTSNETTTSSEGTTKETNQSTDGKTVLNQEAKKEETKAAAPGAPDKYSDFKAPDGIKLDPAVLAKATPIFKELGLSQDSAQKLVDTYRELTDAAVAAPREAYLKMTSDWLKESQDHPDLRGKLGPGQEVNVRIGQLLTSLPDQKLASDFREAMDLTGVGNHPAFIRVFDHVAKLLTEGKHVAGNGPSPGGQSRPGAPSQPGAAAAIWPGLKSATDSR